MDNSQRIAVVTGANKGIGFEICQQLLQKGLFVILTARDLQKGQEALETLKQQSDNVVLITLDVDSSASIHAFVQKLSTEYGRCDVLVNNAGIFPDARDGFDAMPSILDSAIEPILAGMSTHVYGPLQLCQGIIPLMQKNQYGRIVNMSSGMGQLSDMNGCCPGYRISKTALNVLTRIFVDELSDTNILINSMCPGWVKTDMGGPGATRDINDGADTATWLATLEDNGPSGHFFRDRKKIAW